MAAMYVPPTPDEIRRLLERNEQSPEAIADLLAVSSRQVRRWRAGESAMPFAALYVIACEHEHLYPSADTWRDILAL